MLQEIYANFGIGFLVNAIGQADTSAFISPANSGCSLPSLTSGQGQFHITISAYDNSGNPTNPEIILVTANNNGTMTLVRGQEGTTAVAHAANEKVTLGVTAGVFGGAAPSGLVETGVGPYTFDGSKEVMEINPTIPAATTVNILTANLVPFKRYTIADGSDSASTYPILLQPDLGLIGTPGQQFIYIATNGAALTFYWNRSNIRITG
jgi:hypothetical protein